MKKTLLKKLLLLGKIIFGLILSLVIVVSVFPLLPPFKNYYHSRTVLTGSMEPQIPKGSVVINQWADQKNLKVGDVITYQHPADKKIVYITHRIVKIDKTGLLWRFETKGDANPAPDFGLVTQAGTEGEVILMIPLIGYLIEFFKTPVGFILVIALPLLLFIVQQTKDVWQMWKKRNVSPTLIIEPAIDKKSITKPKRRKSAKRKTHKTLAMILIVFSFLAARVSFVTYASFTSGQAAITGVTLSTAASFPGDVVINEVYYDVKSPEKGIEGNNEWVEVYNLTDGAIDISGWKIEDNQGLSYQRTIPSSSPIPAHGYAVITPNVSTWGYWSIPDGAIKIILGNSIGNGLNNDSDRVILKTPGGVEIDAMSYGTDAYAFSPACPDVVIGHSLSRKPAGYDTNTATDWIDTYSGSTPPGPNPGTNPHNEDGSLVVPTTTLEPSPTPSPAVASPSAQLTLSADQKNVSFTINHVDGFKSLSYQLSYDTSTVPQGVLGKADIAGDSYSSGDILLGTCSTGGTCVFHQGVKNFNLEVNLIDSSNQTTTIKTSL